MSASNPASYEQITLESNDQERTVDLRLGTVSVDYYEDIFSPTITDVSYTHLTLPTKA